MAETTRRRPSTARSRATTRRSTRPAKPPAKKVLAIDIGGHHVKILATGRRAKRQADSGPSMTAQQMVDDVKELAQGWDFDVVAMGYPGPVTHNRPLLEPVNLGGGWCGFNFEGAFGKPVKIVNDALMQAIGSYEGGRMLFLGLGTGLGSAMIVDSVGQPMELAHLPYKKGKTFEDYLGDAARRRMGKKRWRKQVFGVVEKLQAALEPDYIVIGGGGVEKLDQLPPGCRRGDNANAFKGGFRLWQEGGVVV